MAVSRQLSSSFVQYKVVYARIQDAGPIAALFLSYLAFRCRDGECRVSHDNCERYTALTRYQQDKAFATWERLGVTSKRLAGTPPVLHYSVDFDRLDELLNLQETDKLICKELAPNLQETRTSICKKLANSVVTKEEKKEEEKKERAPRSSPAKKSPIPSLDELALMVPDTLSAVQGFSEAWADWAKDRKDRGKPITLIGAREQLKLLSQYSRHSVQMIRSAINAGWQGLHPPRDAKPTEPIRPAGRLLSDREISQCWEQAVETMRDRGVDVDARSVNGQIMETIYTEAKRLEAELSKQ